MRRHCGRKAAGAAISFQFRRWAQCKAWALVAHDELAQYRDNWERIELMIVSFTHLNTNLTFSVLMAQVRCV